MQDYSPSKPQHRTPYKSIGFIYIIPLGLFFGFLAFTLAFVFRGEAGEVPSLVIPTPTKTPFSLDSQVTAEPTQPKLTPTPEVTIADIAPDALQVTVLNGSGKAGVAKKGAATLKAAGYTKTTFGNADEDTFTNVTIRYTKGASGSVSGLRKALEEDYIIGKTEETDLTGSTDVEVIIGNEEN